MVNVVCFVYCYRCDGCGVLAVSSMWGVCCIVTNEMNVVCLVYCCRCDCCDMLYCHRCGECGDFGVSSQLL